jgi:tetratricopeptide (TPR) repeat protein
VRKYLYHLTPLILLALAAYSNTFHVPFVFDDVQNIVENPTIKRIGHLMPWGTEGSLTTPRYMGYLSLALNYRLNGLAPAGYHAVNLLVHVANAVLAYFLALLLLRGSREENSGGLIAFSAALLFACHPVQTQAVTYTVQRFTSLASMFFLLSSVLYVQWRRSGTTALYAASVLSAALAVKTKEIAFVLPVVLGVYEFMFLEGSVRRRILYLLPFLLLTALVPLSLLGVGGPVDEAPGDGLMKDLIETTSYRQTVSRWEYLLTQSRVVVTYMRLLILPIGQNLDYGYPVYRSPFNPQVLLSLAFLLTVFFTAALLLRRSLASGGWPRLAVFGIFWFFITISVESSVIPISDVIAEQRVYLPSIGAFIFISTGTFHLTGRLGIGRGRVLSAFILVALVLLTATYARNATWGSGIGIWEDTVSKSPGNARAHYNLGTAYGAGGLTDRAMESYRTALRLWPFYHQARVNLGVAYESKNMSEEAIAQYEAALRLKPDYAEAYYNLGLSYMSLGLPGRAAVQYRRALDIRWRYKEAHNSLGGAYLKQERLDEAMESLRTALKQDPDFAEAQNNMGTAYLKKGLPGKAVEHYGAAVRLRPQYAEAHFNLALAYLADKREGLAGRQYDLLMGLDPALAEKLLKIASGKEESAAGP